MNWIQHPVQLQNEYVRLEPLSAEHFEELLAVAQSPEIWQFLSLDGTDRETLRNELKSALLRRPTGEEYPFTIFDNRTGKIIGSTRFYNIFPGHRKLEIGWTWYTPQVWGKGHNIACKLLLLTYCFEVLNTVRVQFQAHDKNMRSRAAIRKIGAKYEGTLRNERIRYNGEVRSTAIFSIIDEEWPEVKRLLEYNQSSAFNS
ncbi:MAG: N-acetyltransferase [Sphingobacteriales bacterium]|nr:MAG: N-acetyltransferase [Sphingobacteriales bacterium]